MNHIPILTSILILNKDKSCLWDLKYDILKHPNVALTTDGKAKPYVHGKTNNAIATVVIDYDVNNYKFDSIKDIEDNYEIISSEDMDKYLEERNGKNGKRN